MIAKHNTANWNLISEVSGDDSNPVTKRFKCHNGCCDQHEWCRFWASAGECTTNRGWMTDNCQLACNTCQKGIHKSIQMI
uniref:ShKT domain-containing protein n=1 Tax=Elaeophora elaphi TaxID=1147741 RepID=A0A0R3RI74_9BILA